MSSAPTPQPSGTIIPITLQEFAELIVRRMADEQIAPLNAELNKIGTDVLRLKDAVLDGGQRSLQGQIERLSEEVERIGEEIASSKRNGTTPSNLRVANLEDKNTEFRQRLIGAYYGLGALGGILGFFLAGLEMFKLLSHAK